GLRALLVEGRLPGGAAVTRLPDTAGRGARVVDTRLAGDRRRRGDAPGAGRPGVFEMRRGDRARRLWTLGSLEAAAALSLDEARDSPEPVERLCQQGSATKRNEQTETAHHEPSSGARHRIVNARREARGARRGRFVVDGLRLTVCGLRLAVAVCSSRCGRCDIGLVQLARARLLRRITACVG